ncbi:virB8 family protein [Xanthomonas arboricola pv. juglandis]|uniref:virB8 family protein n=1 Tax=Xanthomonas arboricola TaxID=56448 RepID=UPI00063E7534|nr:type IV secretion system protein [Xanthomonas arboricola]MDN0221440.1 type IV secretion system protein [Xanthomonas arboricola pv. juglandis]MDN0225714.1 type IV secretion system protein [Xanthomonas arboricola pv. juglandis]MDN0229892.1 type IV secretion system protein [Xanthomonas arboricola pv. juglandis]MDN0234196.1 type IV secretion system protein [Xanthomonas arboricola pv. juglandis]MDN0238493.1 type IV secretion system protein [Xanthomonas arboricola pv. juglandis]
MLRKKVSEKDGSAQVGAAVQKAVNYEVSIADLARRSEKRAWMVATVSMIITVMTAGGYYYMLPLKEKVPYLVMADAYSGTSTIAKLEANFGGRTISTSEALARSNIARFIIARESFDLSIIGQRDWNTVSAMGATNVVNEYRALHSANNPLRPLNTYGKLRAIRINILSITLIGGKGQPYKGANVRFQRTVYDKNSTVSTLLDNKIATMGFVYQDNLEMSDSLRVENPLGFRVTDYRVDNDYSSLPAAPAGGAVINPQPQSAAQQVGTGMIDPGAANASGAVQQGGVPLQQGALPQGGVPQQQVQPAFPDQMQPAAQPAIQPQGMQNNVNGASGR